MKAVGCAFGASSFMQTNRSLLNDTTEGPTLDFFRGLCLSSDGKGGILRCLEPLQVSSYQRQVEVTLANMGVSHRREIACGGLSIDVALLALGVAVEMDG